MVISLSLALDEFDLVAVRIFDEGNHGGAMLHWPSLACHLSSAFFYFVAGSVGVIDFQCDMTVTAAEVVFRGIPIVRKFAHRLLVFVAVADEGERETPIRIVSLPQHLHAEYLGIEIDRTLEVAHSQHGMEDSHGLSLDLYQLEVFLSCATFRANPIDWHILPAGTGG